VATSDFIDAGFETRAIRVGQAPDESTGATIVPVYQTATFTQIAVGEGKGFDYSRSVNPTRSALEAQLASLEGGRFGAAFGSGMAAAHGVTGLLKQGDHIVATRDIYGGTHRLLSGVLPRYGIETTYVDMTDLAATRAAIQPNTKLLWIETPTNPLLSLIDIRAICAIRDDVCAGGRTIYVAADNTFATPYLQQPLALGVDVVMHSTTKYICGHSDVIGGVVISDDAAIHEQIAYIQNSIGAVPGPWDAYLTLRGAKTLAVRMREHEKNAAAVAKFLVTRDDITQVYYPGLESHPQHELAKQQMRGFGGVVSLRVRGGAKRAHEIAKRVRIFNLATSLGGVESLICSPPVMTHKPVPEEQRIALGITDDLLRLSVGIETIEDLIADLTQAFDSTLDLAQSEFVQH
jgi:cystathionine beta-lyase/cystathionine gamma-synthase